MGIIYKELEIENNVLLEDYEKFKKEDENNYKEFEDLFKKHNAIKYQNLKNDEEKNAASNTWKVFLKKIFN